MFVADKCKLHNIKTSTANAKDLKTEEANLGSPTFLRGHGLLEPLILATYLQYYYRVCKTTEQYGASFRSVEKLSSS